MRKAAFILLVLLILLMVLPMGISMAMTGMCPVHAPACAAGLGVCSLAVGLTTHLIIAIVGFVRQRSTPIPLLLLSRPLERPPRI